MWWTFPATFKDEAWGKQQGCEDAERDPCGNFWTVWVKKYLKLGQKILAAVPRSLIDWGSPDILSFVHFLFSALYDADASRSSLNSVGNTYLIV